MKNKNLILKATILTLGTIIFISCTQVLSKNISKSTYELQPSAQQNNNMIFFGFGHIGLITVDGEYYLNGNIKGNISIENTYSGTLIPYFLLIKDKVNKKIELKWSLPEEFVLKNFSGVGIIRHDWIPHSTNDWTEFFLMGLFEKIITN